MSRLIDVDAGSIDAFRVFILSFFLFSSSISFVCSRLSNWRSPFLFALHMNKSCKCNIAYRPFELRWNYLICPTMLLQQKNSCCVKTSGGYYLLLLKCRPQQANRGKRRSLKRMLWMVMCHGFTHNLSRRVNKSAATGDNKTFRSIFTTSEDTHTHIQTNTHLIWRDLCLLAIAVRNKNCRWFACSVCFTFRQFLFFLIL